MPDLLHLNSPQNQSALPARDFKVAGTANEARNIAWTGATVQSYRLQNHAPRQKYYLPTEASDSNDAHSSWQGNDETKVFLLDRWGLALDSDSEI